MTPLRIAIAGADGRMGQALVRAIGEDDGFALAGTLLRESGSGEGNRATALKDVDAVIDFTAPDSSVQLSRVTSELKLPHVIGTTGFSAEQDAQISAAARQTAIVKSGNMSVGITLLAALVKQAASALPDFDIQILEMHHRAKVDAPSGTALLLGDAAAKARNTPRDSIGIASLRGGTVTGEHAVIFAGPQERLVLSHTAEDRIIFARGAVAAARWLQGKPPGLYTMADVLGLSA
ncbi:MAG: 4-hydroxy-tetrahydrodipicolinate reductase [Alphaproteobacteria bacterium]|nr:4-hydroxy-tetrahydrodipicolinate reductase [Alphaproteobacteria bacterium]